MGHNPCFSGILFAISLHFWFKNLRNLSQSLFQWNTLCNLIPATVASSIIKSQSLFQWNTLCNHMIFYICIMTIRSQSLFQWNTLCNIKAIEQMDGIFKSQSLFQWNTLCNSLWNWFIMIVFPSHNPCFSGILFAIKVQITIQITNAHVTILVLVEYSLQYYRQDIYLLLLLGHNPCFSGILFAIL